MVCKVHTSQDWWQAGSCICMILHCNSLSYTFQPGSCHSNCSPVYWHLSLTVQFYSHNASPATELPRCLDEVTKMQKKFVLSVFEIVSPGSWPALQGAHQLAPEAVAKYVNNICSGCSGPEPVISPCFLTRMSFDLPKVSVFFAHFQPLYYGSSEFLFRSTFVCRLCPHS